MNKARIIGLSRHHKSNGERLTDIGKNRGGCCLPIDPQNDLYTVFDQMEDEEIVDIARAGSTDAQEYLIHKYKSS